VGRQVAEAALLDPEESGVVLGEARQDEAAAHGWLVYLGGLPMPGPDDCSRPGADIAPAERIGIGTNFG